MGADELGRQQQHGGAVDIGTVVGVVAVRHPHPLGPLHNPHVDAAAPSGAGFDVQIGEAFVKGVQQPVKGQGLVVDGGRPMARTPSGADRHVARGPGLRRDLPVAQARRRVAPRAEPAVVEHEALDADGRGLVRE